MEKIKTQYDTVYVNPNDELILPDGTALTGRIERFLYAICILDSDNIPVPMSRIEEFCKALITNEIPDTEPQSSTEEFYLAILTGNIDNLPEPISRVQVLLDKLARNNYDISDIEPIQSRYELLLAIIIKNGGLGNIEYVLYEFTKELETLYNTQEKPIKSAILTGKTLVNFKNKKLDGNNVAMFQSAYGDRIPLRTVFVSEGSLIKPSTTYLLKFTITDYTNNYGTSSISLGSIDYDINGATSQKATVNITGNGDYYLILTTKPTLEHRGKILIKGESTLFENNTESDVHLGISKIVLLEYQEGIENWDIPYFEGMQSVQMPVLKTKNKQTFVDFKEVSRGEGNFVVNSSSDGREVYITTPRGQSLNYVFDYEDGQSYTIKLDYETGIYAVDFYSVDGRRRYAMAGTGTIELDFIPQLTDGRLIEIVNNRNGGSLKLSNIELCPTSNKDEPYKTNILTVNEEVELRGIGDVKDTLDCLTGEVTERIGEIVLDGSGSQNWNLGGSANWNNDGNTTGFYIKYYKTKNNIGYSDKLPLMSDIKTNDTECFYINSTQNWIGIRLSKSKLSNLTYEGVKVYLQSNPVTIRYQLATESIKTVDLTVADQDDNKISKFKTFNDITYVRTESETGVLPEVSIEVAVDDESIQIISENQNSISLLQDEIEKTISNQSQETDNTMVAVTEIYEESME